MECTSCNMEVHRYACDICEICEDCGCEHTASMDAFKEDSENAEDANNI